ncbi:MAG: hypothetical protein Q9P14_01015 [candidate division KSB1 bacterium]|nr:hypothetical protein [candidate division KSB1 bacterium]MDQ7066381.1 hypothetical protein [candidate division KSB1 bacterium]
MPANEIVVTVSVPAGPAQPGMVPDGSRLFVACRSADRVAVIDTRIRSVEQIIRTFGLVEPTGCAISPDGSLALISNANGKRAYFPRRVPGPRRNVLIWDIRGNQPAKVLEVESAAGFMTVF